MKRVRDKEHFLREVQLLKRLRHDHVITLFTTYEYRGYFHLILPWADCNLAKYWETRRCDCNPPLYCGWRSSAKVSPKASTVFTTTRRAREAPSSGVRP